MHTTLATEKLSSVNSQRSLNSPDKFAIRKTAYPKNAKPSNLKPEKVEAKERNQRIASPRALSVPLEVIIHKNSKHNVQKIHNTANKLTSDKSTEPN